MKRLLLSLLAALALPTAVNATNYLECEAIYNVASWTAQILSKGYGSTKQDFKNKQQKIYDQAMKDAKKEVATIFNETLTTTKK